MFSSSILSIIMGAGLVSSATIPKRHLSPDEIIVYGGGRVEIMNKTTYAELHSGLKVRNPAPFHPSLLDPSNPPNPAADSSAPPHRKRSCDDTKVFILSKVETLLGKDVMMSSVVHATGDTATVAVTEGYSISNTLTVNAGLAVEFKEFITSSLGISYSETWTSTYSATYRFGVPKGKYAAVVSNPVTTRQTGYVDAGCIGSATRHPFQSDSYTSKAHGGLSWVDGTISLCLGDKFPLEECHGERPMETPQTKPVETDTVTVDADDLEKGEKEKAEKAEKAEKGDKVDKPKVETE